MEGTSACKTFTFRDATIEVRQPVPGRFTVTFKKAQWKVTRANLGRHKAAWFILQCTKRRTKAELLKPIKVGEITTILAEGFGNFKMNGVEWISLRMVHGVRPVILKAPKLFRQRLIYMEPSGNQDNFNLRIVDPFSDQRTEPQEISRAQADAAIRVFGSAPNQGREAAELHGR